MTGGGVLVAAVGNPDRGDDGVGPAVAQRLRRSNLPAGVSVRECGGDLLGLIETWRGCRAVILVDAAAPSGRPGHIRRLDLAAEALPAGLARGSTHALGIAEAVELARTLGQLPRRLVLYLVEGEQFAIGAGLSPAVAAAIAPVAARILAELSETVAEARHA